MKLGDEYGPMTSVRKNTRANLRLILACCQLMNIALAPIEQVGGVIEKTPCEQS